MTTTDTAPALDVARVEEFVGRAVSDAGAAVSVLLAHLGDRLGLYAAMADGAALTPAELADRAGTHERLTEEWLNNQAVGGYVHWDRDTGRFRLPPEHAFALAEETSPALVQGLFALVASVFQSIDKEEEVLRSGSGLAWRDHHPMLFSATERSFRPGYTAHLVQEWVPAVPGLHERLSEGAAVADVGCGYGAALVLLAAAYPRSRFVGFDYHGPSLDAARAATLRAGVADRVDLVQADATAVTGDFDLVTFFDCWHDTADPLGAARAARRSLTDDGLVLVVEPLAGDRLEDNMNPLGRFGYGISTVVCAPCSVSGGGPGLGAQAGESRTRELFTRAGFAGLDRIAETPLNVVYAARP